MIELVDNHGVFLCNLRLKFILGRGRNLDIYGETRKFSKGICAVQYIDISMFSKLIFPFIFQFNFDYLILRIYPITSLLDFSTFFLGFVL